MSTKVVIIVNPNFGKRLANLPLDVAAWIIESPVNTSAVKGFCEQQPPKNHVAVPTIFRGSPESSPEDVFINEFSTIDLHHGPYSANPPYSEIEVFGVPLTP